ncbi:MAG: glycosyltransferase family 39 protein [Candidatus Omnitrophica bacterium]|nr:glycosyltransferase family 39 protein [Candidatus Omnitrophota bacterium]
MRKILIISVLGILTAGIFIMFGSPAMGPDATQYDRIGYNLACGRGFSQSESAPYLPTMYREPAYPVFLAAVYRAFGHNPIPVVFVQILLHAMTAVMAYFIARHIFSENAAFLSGIMVAVFPTLANTASYILSETLFTFELCLSVLLLLLALKRQTALRFAVCGAVFGLLTLTKTIVLFLPFAILAMVFISRIVKKAEIKRFVVYSVLLIAVYMGIISVWPIRNKMVFNTFSMASRGGMVIWSRAEKIDDSPRELMATVTCSFSEYLGKKLFPDIITVSNRYFFKDLEREMALEDEYAKQGMPPGEIDKKMAGEAFRKISEHPFRYLGYTFIEGIKMTAFTYTPLLNEESVTKYFSKTRNGELVLALMKGMSRSIAYILILLVFIAMIKNIYIWDRWIALAVIILYVNLMYSLLDAIGRYAVPLIPLYCILAAPAFFDRNKREKHE